MEIIDKNFSEKDTDKSIEEDYEKSISTWHDLLQNLSVNHLKSLENIFKKHENKLTKQIFFEAIDDILKPLECSSQIVALFNQVVKNNETSISWSQFLDFLIHNLESPYNVSLGLQVTKIIDLPQTKRETIVKIVLIETDKYFCYAMISKHGRVGLYDGNLNFLTTYQIIMTREDIYRKEEERRKRNRWVTDAVFCVDVLMFIVTNSVRSIVIYEASGLKHVPFWLILSTPNIAECLAYKCSPVNEKGGSTLFMGDDKGVVTSLIFLQSRTSLLRKKHNDKMNLFYWDELTEEKDFVSVKRICKPYQESVKRLIYYEENGILISCSEDSNASLLIKPFGSKNQPHCFKMHKGCNCFALSQKNRILISGSGNGVLRLWNPIITSKPIAVLKGHQTTIVDVKIMDKHNLFISCSKDAMLKIWDMKDQKCIQSHTINFPSFSIFGKLIEWGIESIYPGPKRNFEKNNSEDIWERFPILIACCNHTALIEITQRNTKEEGFGAQVLPPPPLQNSVLIPKMWKTSDSIKSIDFNGVEPNESLIDDELLQKRINELSFILERNFFADNGSSSNDINFKIAALERKKLQMQEHVAKGAPYLALDLHEVNNLSLTPNLPIPKKKKIKELVENINIVLADASRRDLIFSEPSSSRSPRSSRSSFIEFD